MYKIDTKDAGILIVCKDGVRVAPFVSDGMCMMHKSMYDPSAELRRIEMFVREFNENFSHRAREGSLNGMRVILVDCNVDELPA